MKLQTKLSTVIGLGIILTIAGGWYLRNQPAKSIINHSADTSLKINSGSSFETLDSTRYSTLTAASTIANVFDGLYGHNAKGTIIADISKGSPSVSADKLTYTYALRHYQWSNGTPVTADDFVYAWQRLANPATESRMAARIDVIKNGEAVRMGTKPVSALGVKALGKYTLQVKLSAPTPYLNETLASAPFMPINREYAKKQGKLYGTSSAHIITNGPFVINHWSGATDTNWQFAKNTHYFFRKNVQLTKINFSVTPSSAKAAAKFSRNQLDYTAIDSSTVPTYLGNRKLHRMTTTTGAYLFFNTTSGPTKNVHLRRAIATAFDKNLFASGKLQNGSHELNGLIPANLSKSPTGKDFRKENGNLLSYDVGNAIQNWHQAQSELGTSRVSLNLNVANNGEAKLAGNFLKGQLEHNLPGLKVNLIVTSLNDRVKLETSGDYQIVFSTWTPSDVDPYSLLSFDQTDSRSNISGYSNAKYDKMLRDISVKYGANPTKRWRKAQAAERFIMTGDVPTAGVYQGGLSYLLSDRVETFPVLPNGIINYEYVRLH
jgi:ABC-type oligopeptide transport system substrate-binding subunit